MLAARFKKLRAHRFQGEPAALAVASEHGYFVFSYEPDELGLRFELSAGRQVDRERMSVDYAGR